MREEDLGHAYDPEVMVFASPYSKAVDAERKRLARAERAPCGIPPAKRPTPSGDAQRKRKQRADLAVEQACASRPTQANMIKFGMRGASTHTHGLTDEVRVAWLL